MAYWIWYFGDYECYHSLLLHGRRSENNYVFPPFWRLDGPYHNVVFRKECELPEAGEMRITAHGEGMLEADGRRYPVHGEDGGLVTVPLTAGRHVIEVKLMSTDLPCLYAEGAVETDGSWQVCSYGGPWMKAGWSWQYRKPEDSPLFFPFTEMPIEPVSVEKVQGGMLYDFGRETFGNVKVGVCPEEHACLRFGESREEALSEEAYLQERWNGGQQQGNPVHVTFAGRAFRYLWLSSDRLVEVSESLLPVRKRGSFSCSDVQLNRIWEVSQRTFHLCSREFFLDGIKRDRWVWSGDAYQSYYINRYCFADESIVRRTILALRGKDPVEHHINTILDYSFYWIMSLLTYYEETGDGDFLRSLWPRAVSLMDYCLRRRDENGFAVNEGNGWIFVDWADIDKEYAVCAEQMLLRRALEAMATLAELAGADGQPYRAEADALRDKIDAFFWDEEKGAYIDSYASGKRNVTRHANIFALLFGYAGEKRQRILQNVLLNDAVPAIRTPYFKFYELDALCDADRTEEVLRRIRSYWGSMLEGGATSIWEEYSPDEPMESQYGMYGDKFGKSLCHAWGASPIYLLGRWVIGVKPTSPGYRTFEVRPQPEDLEWFEGNVPIGPWWGEVHVRVEGHVCTACATVDGGTLYWQGKAYPLEKKVVLRVGGDAAEK